MPRKVKRGESFRDRSSANVVTVSVIVAAILIGNGLLHWIGFERGSLLLIYAGFAILFIGVLLAVLYRGGRS